MSPSPAIHPVSRPSSAFGPLPLEANLGRLEAPLDRERREREALLDRWLTVVTPKPKRFGWSAVLPLLG